MALMEWEFTEGPDNEGQFMATGKVIETLRRHLGRNEVDEAVALYETCVQETVGQQVWEEFQTASTSMKKAIANLFFRSRDYQRAGQACEALGEWAAAARAYEAAHDWLKAAACAEKTGDRRRAADMYQRAGDARRAAELHYEDERWGAAAEALEVAGDLVGAGQLYIRAGDDPRAARALSRVTPQDPRFVVGVSLLSEVFVRMSRRDLAIQRLAAVVGHGQPVPDSAHAELAYRLGTLMFEEGQVVSARTAFEQVKAFDPGFRDVGTRLQALDMTGDLRPQGPVEMSSAQVAVAPAASRDLPRVVTGRPMPPPATTDPFAALSGNPFAPRESEPVPLVKPKDGYVLRMPGYDLLKGLPIFEDLALAEMKAFYRLCEPTSYEPGEIVIEQGNPGSQLVIVRQGTLRVTRIDDRGTETELARVPAGQYVGEMSLIDAAPTSARVSAAEPVRALRITKNRFEHFLSANDHIALRVYRSFVRTLSGRLRDQNARR